MPFVYLTALSDRANELKGVQLGADDYITKPIDFDILTAIITARIARVARTAVWPNRWISPTARSRPLPGPRAARRRRKSRQILDLTKRTVDFHIDNARMKLNAATRMHAAVKAAAGGLIEP